MTAWYEFQLLKTHLYHGCFRPIEFSDFMEEILLRPEFKGCVPVEMQQIHGADVAVITKASKKPLEVDGLITQNPSLALVIRHADCQPCLIFDPKQQLLAAIHCGWRGSCANIYQVAIEKLVELGAKPEDLLVGIGPSIGPCHAEFVSWQTDFPSSFERYRDERDYFDFWRISRDQLLACGVLARHIEIARLCTHCHPELFHSYRRDKTTLRNITVAALIGH